MAVSGARTRVPKLIVTQDNAFWFEAARQGRLVLQRCAACAMLRHPPGPACPRCRSFEWDVVEASRRCRLHSYTVIHHPQDEAFEYPLVVGLVDLAEGPRLVCDVAGIAPDELEIGMELEGVLHRARPR